MDALRIHWLQHVPFEGLGSIESWVRKKGHRLTGTRMWNAESVPSVADLDWLIVMGGPMSVADEALFHWLVAEKRFIQDCLAAGKRVLGICLGAQLVAEALGAKVAPNREPEIGWFPVRFDAAACAAEGWQMFSETLSVFHWHGDRFEIPQGATLLGQSVACDRQAFCHGRRVLGLQFHLETTEEGAKALIEHCQDELGKGPFIQAPEQMLPRPERFSRIHQVMKQVLERIEHGA
ncbi:MAG: type 1 glutamine amidotransferase [Desulfobacterales bacterium]|nr:type 1 glutamine amidotransferase [Desulfobacterales bacterium]